LQGYVISSTPLSAGISTGLVASPAWLAISLAMQFAYHFPRRLFPRETRYMLILSLGLWGVFVVLMSLEARAAQYELCV